MKLLKEHFELLLDELVCVLEKDGRNSSSYIIHLFLGFCIIYFFGQFLLLL